MEFQQFAQGAGPRIWFSRWRRPGRTAGAALRQVLAQRGPTSWPAPRELRAILQIIDSPPLPADLLAVARFIADYYQVPTGDALRLVLPPGSEARSAQRLTLTPEGSALAPHLDDALLPPALAALSGHALLLWRGVAALTRSAAQKKRGEAGTVLLARVLTWLAGQPGGRPKDLIPSAVQRALGELQRAGLLSESEHIAAGPAPKREVLVHARPGPLSEEEEGALRRRPSQSALLTRLRDVGSLPLSVLRREFPGAPLHVKALVSAGGYLGRAPDCLVRTDDPCVSRRNCRIIHLEGEWVVEDLQSASGTYVNERRIQRALVRHGDVIRCGALQVRFVLLGEEWGAARTLAQCAAPTPSGRGSASTLVGGVGRDRAQMTTARSATPSVAWIPAGWAWTRRIPQGSGLR